MIQRPLVARVAALLLTLKLVAGYGVLTTPPESHSELLTIVTSVAVFEVVMTPDLWEKSTPSSGQADLRAVEGKNPGGGLADRGLRLYTLTSNQLVAYLNHVQPLAYGGWLQKAWTPEVFQRIYDEITPVVRGIDGPRGPEEQAPRVVLDGTITDDA